MLQTQCVPPERAENRALALQRLHYSKAQEAGEMELLYLLANPPELLAFLGLDVPSRFRRALTRAAELDASRENIAEFPSDSQRGLLPKP